MRSQSRANRTGPAGGGGGGGGGGAALGGGSGVDAAAAGVGGVGAGGGGDAGVDELGGGTVTRNFSIFLQRLASRRRDLAVARKEKNSEEKETTTMLDPSKGREDDTKAAGFSVSLSSPISFLMSLL